MIKLMSISKGIKRNAGREIIHLKEKNITLKNNDPLLYFVQQLRDEAHRFAITSHRKKRSSSAFKSSFDEIKGIGKKRKKILMLHFGNLDNIKNASLKELKELKNIPYKILKDTYDFFNN